jgi:hypothetical protein
MPDIPPADPLLYVANPVFYLPFLALIEFQRSSESPYYCVGTLIDRSTIVSSAQCLNGMMQNIQSGVISLHPSLQYRALLIKRDDSQNSVDIDDLAEYEITNITLVSSQNFSSLI